MGASTAFATLTYRLYPRMTVDAAADLVVVPPVGRLEDFERHRHCTVVTFRRDGSGVATPVWFALDGERLVFRSLTPAAKLRRIAHDPTVLVAPCSSLGSPKGPPLRGRADLLAGGAAAAAEDALRARYGSARRLYKRAIAEAPAQYVAITPD